MKTTLLKKKLIVTSVLLLFICCLSTTMKADVQYVDFQHAVYYTASGNTLTSSGDSLYFFNYSTASTTHPLMDTAKGVYFRVVDYLGNNLWLRVRHMAADPNGTSVGFNIPNTSSSPFRSGGFGGWGGFLYEFDIYSDINLSGARGNTLNGFFNANVLIESIETLSAGEWLSLADSSTNSDSYWVLNSINYSGNNPGSHPGFSSTSLTTAGPFSPTFPTNSKNVYSVDLGGSSYAEFRVYANDLSEFSYGYEYSGGASGYQGIRLAVGFCFSNTVLPTGISTNLGTTTVCVGDAITLKPIGGTLGFNSHYKWYEGSCGVGTPISIEDSLVVSPSAGSHHYYVSIDDPCLGSNALCADLVITGTTAERIWRLDADGDHYSTGGFTNFLYTCHSPGPGWSTETMISYDDCDDNNPLINYPTIMWYLDEDNDGYSPPSSSFAACTSPGTGYSTTPPPHGYSDCNDRDASIHGYSYWYIDMDHDHYDGGGSYTIYSCNNPGGSEWVNWPIYGNDCDDEDASANVATQQWRLDVDNDGYFFGDVITSCHNPGVGYARYYGTGSDDCDDNDPLAHNDNTLWMQDVDGDHYFVDTLKQCHRPGPNYVEISEYVLVYYAGGDCDDSDPNVNPGAYENPYDLVDDNCNGQIDEALPCYPNFSYWDYYYQFCIGNVSIGAINNTTSCGISKYHAYTNLSTAVMAGSTQTIHLASVEDSMICSVYIDWNQDSYLGSDPTEVPVNNIMVYSAAAGGTDVTFTVPASASGHCVMRVISDRPEGYIYDACNSYVGEAEDYSIFVTCIPVVYYPCSYMWISYVALGTIESMTDCSAGGYTDYSASDTTIAAPGDSVSYNLHGSYADGVWPYQGVSIYIDYNNDGDFDDPDEHVVNFAIMDTSGKFRVPVLQHPGKYRVRVISDSYYVGASTPCLSNYAEAEDYALVVTLSASISSPGPILCTGQVLTALTNAITPSFQWQLDGMDIAGATNSTYEPITAGSYSVVITDLGISGSNIATSTAVSEAINNSFSVTASATPNPVCAGAPLQLSVTATGTDCSGDYSVSSIPFSPVTSGTTNIGPSGDDVVSDAIPIGFTFPFYCTDQTQLYISTNGFISFNGAIGPGCCSGYYLPYPGVLPDNLIAACWTDLNVGGPGSIDYFNLTAPNRFVVRYNDVAHCCGYSPAQANSEIILYESGVIEIHNSSIENIGVMTQGIENAGGTAATVVPDRNATGFSASNDAYRFTPTGTTITGYAWSGPNSFLSDVAAPTISNMASINEGNYSVQVTTVSGCAVNSNLVEVTVNNCCFTSTITTNPVQSFACNNISVTATKDVTAELRSIEGNGLHTQTALAGEPFSFSGITIGTYVLRLYMIDINTQQISCEELDTIYFTSQDCLRPSLTITENDASAPGVSDGSISFYDASDYCSWEVWIREVSTGDVILDNNLLSGTVENLLPGVYYVNSVIDRTDYNGNRIFCWIIDTVMVGPVPCDFARTITTNPVQTAACNFISVTATADITAELRSLEGNGLHTQSAHSGEPITFGSLTFGSYVLRTYATVHNNSTIYCEELDTIYFTSYDCVRPQMTYTVTDASASGVSDGSINFYDDASYCGWFVWVQEALTGDQIYSGNFSGDHIQNLSPGVYYVNSIIDRTDYNGNPVFCRVIDTITVGPPSCDFTRTITTNPVQTAACNFISVTATADITAELRSLEGNGLHTQSAHSGEPITFGSLTFGSYVLRTYATVHNNSTIYCEELDTIYFTSYDCVRPQMTYTVTDASASGVSDGSINFYDDASYCGWFVWVQEALTGDQIYSGNFSGDHIQNLSPGVYYVNSIIDRTDYNGNPVFCRVIDTITVGPPSCDFTRTITTNPVQTAACNFISVTATADITAELRSLEGNGLHTQSAHSGEPITFGSLTFGSYVLRTYATVHNNSTIYCEELDTIYFTSYDCVRPQMTYTVTDASASGVSDGSINFYDDASYCGWFVWVQEALTGDQIYSGNFSGDHIQNLSPGVYYVNSIIDRTDYNGNPVFCRVIDTITVSNSPTASINIKVFIEGFYLGGGQMQPVLYNNDPLTYSADACDSITVELHDSLPPYDLVTSVKVMLHTDGSAVAEFPSSSIDHWYYITIRHRNALETWSKEPVKLTNGFHFDFTQ